MLDKEQIELFLKHGLSRNYDTPTGYELFLVLWREIPCKTIVNSVAPSFINSLLKDGNNAPINSTKILGEKKDVAVIDDPASFDGYVPEYEDSKVTIILNTKEKLIYAFFDSHIGDGLLTLNLYHPVDFNFDFKIIAPFITEIKKEDSRFYILIKHGPELRFKPFKSKKHEVNVGLHYGPEFIQKHELIINKLRSNKNGLYLFNGGPGTGKTSYIKYLSTIIDKKFIYIPEFMVGSLATPDFSNLLLEQRDAVLVIEDAEKAICDRELSDGGLASIILNHTDGIMADILGIQIILTYNIDSEKIDKALRRKGRLKLEHKFEALSIPNAQKLLNELKLDYKATKPMTLAEIFNIYDDNGNVEKKLEKGIGFGSIATS